MMALRSLAGAHAAEAGRAAGSQAQEAGCMPRSARAVPAPLEPPRLAWMESALVSWLGPLRARADSMHSSSTTASARRSSLCEEQQQCGQGQGGPEKHCMYGRWQLRRQEEA